MLRPQGCRGLLFGIAVSLVVLTACPAQGQPGVERARDAIRPMSTDRQTAGTFDRLAGEYHGVTDGDSFVVWVDVSPTIEAGQQAALLLFREQDRARLEAYVRRIIDDPTDDYRKICDESGSGARKGRLNDLYRVWNTQGGLILLQDGLHGDLLAADWEEIEDGDYPPYLRNEEYIVWQGREYAIRGIRRSPRTGALESVQLTQTGFFQNFFDRSGHPRDAHGQRSAVVQIAGIVSERQICRLAGT